MPLEQSSSVGGVPPPTPSEARHRRPAWRELESAGLLVALAIVLPFVLSDYRVFQATMILVTAIAVLGLNILMGYNGQISLGHGAIYGLGAYTTALLVTHAGVPWWGALPVAAVACFVFGFLFGWPALRLHGHYLALATFALALTMPQLLKHRRLERWTGGTQGILLSKLEPPFGWTLSPDRWLYGVTLAITVLMFGLAWNLLRGRLGRAAVAIREQPLAASAMGINVPYIKAMTFGVSALYTGLAGGLGAMATTYVAPDSFGLLVSLFLLVGVVVGGLGTLGGAIAGAVFIQFVPNVADQISKSAPTAIYAVFLIASMYLMPNGFVGAVRSLRRRLRQEPGGRRN